MARSMRAVRYTLCRSLAGHEVGLVGGEPPGRVPEHQPERQRHVDQPDHVDQQPGQPGGPHDRDLRVPADDQGVGVVPGVAPPPGRRVAHDHERGQLVQALVDPARLERRAVPGLVPARIRRRPVQQPVGQEERQRPPAAPERDAEPGEQPHQPQPDDRVPDGRVVRAPHQLLHPLARHRAAEPVPAGQPRRHRRLVLRARQAVPLQPFLVHCRPPSRRARRARPGVLERSKKS